MIHFGNRLFTYVRGGVRLAPGGGGRDERGEGGGRHLRAVQEAHDARLQAPPQPPWQPAQGVLLTPSNQIEAKPNNQRQAEGSYIQRRLLPDPWGW
eukprot:3557096-Pyramimonas_sp.AAC.1